MNNLDGIWGYGRGKIWVEGVGDIELDWIIPFKLRQQTFYQKKLDKG